VLFIDIHSMNQGQKRELSWSEKQIMGEVNQLLFDSFKQHKRTLYGALMRCGMTQTDPESYYQCTEAVNKKETEAEERMKNQLTSYEVNG
jgi:hypothetical protein